MGQGLWRHWKYTGAINKSANDDRNVVVSQNDVSVSNSYEIQNLIPNGDQDHNDVGNVDTGTKQIEWLMMILIDKFILYSQPT